MLTVSQQCEEQVRANKSWSQSKRQECDGKKSIVRRAIVEETRTKSNSKEVRVLIVKSNSKELRVVLNDQV